MKNKQQNKKHFPLLCKEGQILTEGQNRGGLPLLAIMLLTVACLHQACVSTPPRLKPTPPQRGCVKIRKTVKTVSQEFGF